MYNLQQPTWFYRGRIWEVLIFKMLTSRSQFGRGSKISKIQVGKSIVAICGCPDGDQLCPFTKLITPICGFIRSEGTQCFPSLRDWFIFGFTEEECRVGVNKLASLFSDLGFKVHPDKSVFTPTQTLEFLGFIIDSVNMTISLLERKRQNVMEICETALNSQQLSIRFMW